MKNTLLTVGVIAVIAVAIVVVTTSQGSQFSDDIRNNASSSPEGIIRNELWETPLVSPVPQKKVAELVLGIGKTAIFGDLKIKLVSIVSDSRCAEGVQCIWAGDVTARLELWLGDLHDTFDVRNVDPVQGFGSYNLKIESVTPYPHVSVPLKYEDYKVTVRVSQ